MYNAVLENSFLRILGNTMKEDRTMPHLREPSARSFSVLIKILSILGCISFLFSVFYPFFSAEYSDGFFISLTRIQFWSFKSYTAQSFPFLRMAPTIYEYWFLDYWVKESAYRSEFLILFPLMFIAQVSTLITGMASLLVRRKLLAYLPVVLCSIVIALMTYVSMSSEVSWNWQYQNGFWLALVSFFSFLSVPILEQEQKKNSNFHSMAKSVDMGPDRNKFNSNSKLLTERFFEAFAF
jgi:hypothetical protein